ncbi:hypothetical protein SDC9_90887 [bioreactor metagenome]|uniref:Uncharacterized protein n=1 Tax=bioreactor metagenome TaxID=1076179 RepID=A0A644ZT87_9ZZZZ
MPIALLISNVVKNTDFTKAHYFMESDAVFIGQSNCRICGIKALPFQYIEKAVIKLTPDAEAVIFRHNIN